MNPIHSLRVLLVALAMLIAPAAVQPAVADQLDDLRAEGQIGERFDGYAEARSGASETARALVEKINAQRREIYEKQAKQQEISVDQVGRVYAERIVKNLPKGAWIRTEAGWRQL